MLRRAYVLAGPTASGKSRIAQRLAERHGLRILSADSMLVYRGMDVGTAKPSASEQSRVVYAGMDLADPSEPFNTALYLRGVARQLSDPGWDAPFLLTGGTGLYLKALLHGFDPPPAPDPALREALERLGRDSGIEGLRERLRALSPDALKGLADPSNPRRLIRAIEAATTGGSAPSSWKTPAAWGVRILGLEVSPSDLASRIRQRVETMFADGLLEETSRLRAAFPRWSSTAGQAIGYAEASAVLCGELTREEAVERIAARTRQLAKRQRTWLRNQEQVEWIPVGAASGPDELERSVWTRLRELGPHPVLLPPV